MGYFEVERGLTGGGAGVDIAVGDGVDGGGAGAEGGDRARTGLEHSCGGVLAIGESRGGDVVAVAELDGYFAAGGDGVGGKGDVHGVINGGSQGVRVRESGAVGEGKGESAAGVRHQQSDP